MPHTRPKIEFNKDGICSACVAAAQKREQINWNKREKELRAIFDQHRSKNATQYDCIVPVSGGKDSTYQVHVVKNIYKMNPLCVTNRTLARTPRGEENLQSLREMGVDHIDFTVNPAAFNKVTRKAFEKNGAASLVEHLATYAVVARMAVKLRIPLVIWGENPYMEYGGPAKGQKTSQLDNKLTQSLPILQGMGVKDWIGNGVTLQDLQSLILPSEKEMKAIKYTPIFLGYYLPWDAKQNVAISKKYGFKSREEGPVMGLYDYADLDCMNIVIHHYFKWLKFGFNRITDNASNEIRKGRMTREEAIKLVRKHDGVKPPKEYIEHFARQIGITVGDFWKIAEKFRNKDIWKKTPGGEWYLAGWIGGARVPDRFPHLTLSETEKKKLFSRI
jgi:N-acetyl sugar amidotransferase